MLIQTRLAQITVDESRAHLNVDDLGPAEEVVNITTPFGSLRFTVRADGTTETLFEPDALFATLGWTREVEELPAKDDHDGGVRIKSHQA